MIDTKVTLAQWNTRVCLRFGLSSVYSVCDCEATGTHIYYVDVLLFPLTIYHIRPGGFTI